MNKNFGRLLLLLTADKRFESTNRARKPLKVASRYIGTEKCVSMVLYQHGLHRLVVTNVREPHSHNTFCPKSA